MLKCEVDDTKEFKNLFIGVSKIVDDIEEELGYTFNIVSIEDERIERDTDIDNRLVDHVLINNGTIETLAKQFIMIVENIYG